MSFLNPVSNIPALHDEVTTRLLNAMPSNTDAKTLMQAYLVFKKHYGANSVGLTWYAQMCQQFLDDIEKAP